MEMMAIEVTGIIDKDNRLRLNESLPIVGPKPVRVIILSPADDDWNEAEWLQAAAQNPAFDFLSDPAEDIYSLDDGRPFHVEI